MFPPNTESALDAAIYMESGTTPGLMLDISGFSNQINPQFSSKIGDYQVFQQHWVQRLVGAKDCQLQIQAVYNPADGSPQTLFEEWHQADSKYRKPRRIRFELPTGAIGENFYDGYWLLDSFSFTATADNAGPILGSFTVKQAGDGVDIGTIST
jgi:hypothetical protein